MKIANLTPYFREQFGNVYNKQYFNFFNVQYYNNGPSNSYERVFITSTVDFPNVAVLQLMNSGISDSYIVVGKPVNGNEGSAGYTPLVSNLGNIVKQAFANP